MRNAIASIGAITGRLLILATMAGVLFAGIEHFAPTYGWVGVAFFMAAICVLP
jgi:hypothetical protein